MGKTVGDDRLIGLLLAGSGKWLFWQQKESTSRLKFC